MAVKQPYTDQPRDPLQPTQLLFGLFVVVTAPVLLHQSVLDPPSGHKPRVQIWIWTKTKKDVFRITQSSNILSRHFFFFFNLGTVQKLYFPFNSDSTYSYKRQTWIYMCLYLYSLIEKLLFHQHIELEIRTEVRYCSLKESFKVKPSTAPRLFSVRFLTLTLFGHIHFPNLILCHRKLFFMRLDHTRVLKSNPKWNKNK